MSCSDFVMDAGEKLLDGGSMQAAVFFEASRPMLARPDRICPGQNLRTPPA